MAFDLSTAMAVREREDGLLEKDTFDLSTARPVESIQPEIRMTPKNERGGYKPALTEEQKAQAVIELSYKRRGEEVPSGLKADWLLTSPAVTTPEKAILNTVLTGGIYPVIQGIRGALDKSENYDILQRVTKGIFYPEDTKYLYQNIKGADQLPNWANITLSIGEDLVSYTGMALAKSAATKGLLIKNISRKIETAASTFADDNISKLLPISEVRPASQMALVKEDLKTLFKDKLFKNIKSLNVEGAVPSETLGTFTGEVKPSLLQQYAQRKNLMRLVWDEVKALNESGQANIVRPKIGEVVNFKDNTGKVIEGVIKEIAGQRAIIDMAGSQVVATLGQLSKPKVDTELFRGDAKPITINDYDVMQGLREGKELGGAMAEGPGIYFTTDKKNAMAYGNNLTNVSLSGDSNILRRGDQKLSPARINKILQSVDKETLNITLSNWDENPVLAKKALIEAINNADDAQEQLINIWADVFYHQQPEKFMDIMSANGIDGMEIEKKGLSHFVVYNRKAISNKASNDQPAAGGLTNREIPEQMTKWLDKGITITERQPAIRIIDPEAKIKDISGKVVDLPTGHEMTPYKLSNGKIWLHDGKDVIVESGQLQNLKNKNLVLGEKKAISPDEAGVEEVVKGGEVGKSFDAYNKIVEELKQKYDPTGRDNMSSVYSRLSLEDRARFDAAKRATKEDRASSTKFSQYQVPGGENYKENVYFTKKHPVESEPSHFDDAATWNRTNDRGTPDGKRILFIEEIQKNKNLDKSLDNPLAKAKYIKFNLEKLLNKAISEGYDGISWTTGEQQAERYDLSKQVDKVTATPIELGGKESGDGKVIRVFTKQGGEQEVIVNSKGNIVKATSGLQQAVGRNLEEAVGKDLSKKILTESFDKYTEYSGLDLKIGGEWAKNLYDKQIPNILKDLTKGEVGSVEIGKQLKYINSQKAQEAIKRGESIKSSMMQPALMLTPEIKARVMGDQPMAGGLPANQVKKTIRETTGQIKVGDVIKESDALKRMFSQEEKLSKELTKTAEKEEDKLLAGAMKQFFKYEDDISALEEEIKVANYNTEAEKLKAQDKLDTLKKKYSDAKEEQRQKKALRDEVKALVSAINKSPKENIAIEYQGAINNLKDKFDLKNRQEATLAKRESMRAYIARMGQEKRQIDIPADKVAMLDKVNLKDMTLAQLRDIKEMIDNLERLGRTKLKAKEAVYENTKEKIIAKLFKEVSPINSHLLPKVPIGASVDNWTKRAIALQNYSQKTGVGLTPIDGLADVTGMQEMKKVLDADFSKYLIYNDKAIQDWYNLTKDFDESSFKRIGIIAIAMQDGGLGRLLNSGITEDEVKTIKLTPQEEKVYRFVVDTFDKEYPAVKTYSKDVYNTDVGEQKNYVSFLSDYEQLSDLEIYERFGQTPEQIANRKTKTVEQGFTKERANLSNIKLETNIDKIFRRHMDDVAYMLNTGKNIKMYFEVVNSPEMREKLGDVGTLAWLQWLDLMARKGGSEGAKRIAALDVLRRNIGSGVLSFRLSSALIQFSSFADTIATMGAGWASKGAVNIATSSEWRNFIMDNFPEIKKAVGDDIAFREFGEGFLANMARVGSKPLQVLDGIMRATAASAAYEKIAAARGLTVDLTNPDVDIIAEATKLMRNSQGSSFFKDQPLAITAGYGITDNKSFNKLILTFQSFMLSRWDNINRQIWRMGIKEKNYKKAISSFFWLIIFAGAVEEGIRRGSRAITNLGNKDKRKESSYINNSVLNMIQSVPLLGQLVSAITYSSNPVPVINTIDEIMESAGTMVKGKSAETKLKGLITLIGASGSLSGIPGSTQFSSIIRGLIPKGDNSPGRRLIGDRRLRSRNRLRR